MKLTRETDTVRAILQFLQLHRIPAWRVNTGAFRATYKGRERFHRFGVPGMSDIIGILPKRQHVTAQGSVLADLANPLGQFLAIEVKQPRKVPTPAQVAFIQTVILAGGVAFVAHSVAEVKAKLCL